MSWSCLTAFRIVADRKLIPIILSTSFARCASAEGGNERGSSGLLPTEPFRSRPAGVDLVGHRSVGVLDAIGPSDCLTEKTISVRNIDCVKFHRYVSVRSHCEGIVTGVPGDCKNARGM
jgi:hypothetical protein